MAKIITKLLLVPACMLVFASCGGNGSSTGSSGSLSLATIANILGTWLADGSNSEEIGSIAITDTGATDSASIFVVFSDDGSTDTGFLDFVDSNTTTRGIRVFTSSSGFIDGTLSLSDNCTKMTVVFGSDSGKFTNTGNTCTDVSSALELLEDE